MLVLMLYNLTCYWYINANLLTGTAVMILSIWFGTFSGPKLPLVTSVLSILAVIFLLSIV